MSRFRHCTAAFRALIVAGILVAVPHVSSLAQGTAAAPEPGEAEFTIFLAGKPVGREQVNLARSGSDWIVSASGRSGAPLNFVLRRFEMKYTADWQPVELKLEATVNNNLAALATSFGGTNAINEITQNTITNAKTDQVSPRTIVIPNNVFAGYEVLAARIAGAKPGLELPVYVVPQGEVKVTVKAVHEEQVATPGARLATRRYDIVIHNPGGALNAVITIDHRSRIVRLEIPVAALVVARSDVAGVAARTQSFRNPTDVDVSIPGNGFNIAATLTMPPAAASRLRYPAVVLVAGSGAVDRDEAVAGIPIFAQLAGMLAERGFAVLRYDKRGVGQSGGRAESATLQDYADDVISVVKWMERRKDIDKKRLAVAGHSEGGSVAMIAAREKKITSLILIGTPGTTGAELILEQQRHALDLLKTPPDERQAKIELQKRIQNAVVTGEGWDGVPEDLRKQADVPWFRSFLLFDPAKAMPRIKQPILIVQPELDKQVTPGHADKLAELARARRKAPPVEVRKLAGINHLLVRARTGEVSEYGSLPEKKIAGEVAEAIAAWLAK
jgi:pimeloyl-ACP methyl ester carboxylesterase